MTNLTKEFDRWLVQRFTAQQALILKRCLRLNTPVHIIGTGLGKSFLTIYLNKIGFKNVTEAGGIYKTRGPMEIPVTPDGLIILKIKNRIPRNLVSMFKFLGTEKEDLIRTYLSTKKL